MNHRSFDSESTPEGEQTLISGVRPLTARDRLEAQMETPMRPRYLQKPCDLGLFDEAARRQLSLFD